MGLAGLTLVLGYLVNWRVYNEALRQLPERHGWLVLPAFISAVGSYLLFIAGSVLASTELGQLV